MNQKPTPKLIGAIKFPLYFLLLIWLVHIFKVATNFGLGRYGIYPRDLDGVKGIFLAPLIHGDFHHLISNSVPLFVLTAMIFFFYKRVATVSFFLIYVLTGALVWLFGRDVFHIGASGVVYGLVAFVFWSGIFRRNVKSIILALLVTFLYSGYFLGILPNQEGISWESHLMGGLVGILVAFIFKSVIEKDEIKEDPWKHELAAGQSAYFSPDTFEKTRKEREIERNNTDLFGESS